ncbi:MAG: hypothetical protein QXK24_00210 [Ignisphaera sp.]
MCESDRCLREEEIEKEKLLQKLQELEIEKLNIDDLTERKIELLSLVELLKLLILKWNVKEALETIDKIKYRLLNPVR